MHADLVWEAGSWPLEGTLATIYKTLEAIHTQNSVPTSTLSTTVFTPQPSPAWAPAPLQHVLRVPYVPRDDGVLDYPALPVGSDVLPLALAPAPAASSETTDTEIPLELFYDQVDAELAQNSNVNTSMMDLLMMDPATSLEHIYDLPLEPLFNLDSGSGPLGDLSAEIVRDVPSVPVPAPKRRRTGQIV